MPPQEARAMLLLLALAVAGQGVRYFLTRPGDPPGQVQLLGLTAGSPTAQRDSAMRQARPLAPNERIDVDVASPAELARLPRIGLGLAKVIAANREAQGPFGSLAGLDRVEGIGPGLLKAIGPHVIFSQSGTVGQRSNRSATPPDGVDCQSAFSSLPPGCPAIPLDLNTASSSELDALPGVGPAKAAAILQYREQHGRFGSVDALERVPGFGPAAVARLRSRLMVR